MPGLGLTYGTPEQGCRRAWVLHWSRGLEDHMETKILALPTSSLLLCAYKWTFSVAQPTWWEMKISCSFWVCLSFKREARQKFLSPNSKLQLIASAVDGIHQWKLVLSLGMIRACGGRHSCSHIGWPGRRRTPQNASWVGKNGGGMKPGR